MEILINNKAYKLRSVDAAFYGELTDWATKQLPDPFDKLPPPDKLARYSPAQQEYLLGQAFREARTPKTLASPEVQAVLGSPEGIKQQLRLVFGAELTGDQLWELHLQAIKEHGPEYLQQVIG